MEENMWWFYVASSLVLAYVLSSPAEALWMLYQYHYKKEKDVWKSLIKTGRVLSWVAYVFLYQKLTKNIVAVGKNEYDVHYVLGVQEYRVRVATTKGPGTHDRVLQVIDQRNDDVTLDVRPYLGPREDFHGITTLRPCDLKFEELTFNLANGEIKTFQAQDPILLWN